MKRFGILVLFVLFLAVAALLTAWMFGAVEAPRQPAPSPSVPRERVQAPKPAAAVPAQAVPLPEPEDTSEAPATAEAPVPTAPGEQPDDSEPQVAVRGTVVAIDGAGGEHPQEDGSFRLTHTMGSAPGSSQEVPVLGGQWVVTLPRGADLFFGDVVLGGRPATVPLAERFRVPAGGALQVRAHWNESTMLHVLGEDTGLELSGVDVVSWLDHGSTDHEYPGRPADYKMVASGKQSPFELPGKSHLNDYWVRAPEYAWQRIQLDPAQGGERTIRLERSGQLVVEISGYPAPPGARLRLRRSGTGNCQELLETGVAGTGSVLLENLRPGSFEASVELGQCFNDPVSLGTGEAEVTAGAVVRVRLTLEEAPPAPMKVALEGALVIPAEWGAPARSTSIFLTPIDAGTGALQDMVVVRPAAFTAVPGQPGTQRWVAGDVTPGRYQAEVKPYGVQQILDVAADGSSRPEIRLAAPALVKVSVVDAATGQVTRGASVTWHGEIPEEASGYSSEFAGFNGRCECFEIRAPVGKIEITASAPDRTDVSRSLDLTSGTTEITVELAGSFGVRLQVVDADGNHLTGSDSWRVSLVSLDGAGSQESRHSSDGSSANYFVTAPGLYRLEISQVEGYAPASPVEVEIRGAGTETVKIQLVRQR